MLYNKFCISQKLLSVVHGVTGKTGENATLFVEMENKSVSELVPIPLRLKGSFGVQDPARKQGCVTMDHAMVGKYDLNGFVHCACQSRSLKRCQCEFFI